MDSKYVKHHDGVNVPAKNATPAAPTQALLALAAAPFHLNQHSRIRTGRRVVPSRRGPSFNDMSREITQGENNALVVHYSLEPVLQEYQHGDLDCMALTYHGDGLDVIFSVHRGAGGTFKRAKFIVRHEGTDGQPPIIRIIYVDLPRRGHEWVRDFIGQVAGRIRGDTSGQMYDAVSTFYSAVCSNSLPPRLISPTSATISGSTMRENAVKECPPWNDLPLDCYRLIRDCLDGFGILSFPLVCKAWAEVYTENRRLQPGAPTLLTSPSYCGYYEHPDEWYRGIFFVQNINLSRETFFVEVDGFRYRRWIGGKDEWLVINDVVGSIELLNPNTGDCTCLFPDDETRRSFQRVQLCRTPAEADGYFAIAISHNRLSYTTAKTNQWFMLENPQWRDMRYTDAILHRGKILAVCLNGDLWSWDLDERGANPKLLLRSAINSEGWEEYDFLLAPSLNDNLLIVSPYGERLPVRMACDRSTFRNLWHFRVQGAVLREVDTDAESMEDVHNIGGRSLFLGPNYPFYVPVPVPSGDLKTNRVYISDISDYDVVSIDLTNENPPGNVTMIDYKGPSTPYQVPMWFRPAFPGNLA